MSPDLQLGFVPSIVRVSGLEDGPASTVAGIDGSVYQKCLSIALDPVLGPGEDPLAHDSVVPFIACFPERESPKQRPHQPSLTSIARSSSRV